MKRPAKKIAGRPTSEWEALSAELDDELAGAVENTEPMSEEELRWYRRAAGDTSPKVRVTFAFVSGRSSEPRSWPNRGA